MKILYHHRIASKDGQYVHVAEIISSLEKLGHEVIVCEPNSIKSTEFGSGSKAVQGIRAYVPAFIHELAELLYTVYDYWKLSRLIKTTRPDFIYERYNLYFLSGVWASKRLDLPLLLEVNSPIFEERSANQGISLSRLARWTQDYVWKNADAVLPVTEVLARIVQQRGIAENVITVIPNGINSDFVGAAGVNDPPVELSNLEGKLVLGFTGFVREWHSLERALEVIAANLEEDWHLLLVGDGPDRERLAAIATNLGVQDRFTVTGIIDRADIPAWLGRFDIALQPDVVPYASPLKLFEYMALGKAIIAPDMENIREILEDRRDALLFDDSQGSFSRNLLLLCEDGDLRQRLGEAARQTMDHKELYWDRNAEKIIAVASALARPDDSAASAPSSQSL